MTVFSKMTAKCWTLPETGFRPCAFSPIMDPDQICHHTRLYTSLVKALEFWDLGFFFFFVLYLWQIQTDYNMPVALKAILLSPLV